MNTGIEEINLDRLEVIQNRLASAMIKQASALQVKAGDWVQGGWSRSSANIIDRMDAGYRLGQVGKE
ncbi:MAG TPA: hypothetical protein VI727_04865 [Candidatus Brocadiaceae bacterium]|nr:hypothetical protein [Candidatus Brocadiaceae bacterium]